MKPLPADAGVVAKCTTSAICSISWAVPRTRLLPRAVSTIEDRKSGVQRHEGFDANAIEQRSAFHFAKAREAERAP